MELVCSIMHYDWGKIGKDSLVARLAEINHSNLEIDEEKSYAELWMGTHPNGPSVLKITQEPLKDYINNNVSVLGKGQAEFGTDIPYLFKILSIRKALSVQVHPNKADAVSLHLKYPKLYKDDNHKPELAVALTDFEALCGFRPLDEIADFLQNIPELDNLIDAEYLHSFIKEPTIKLLENCFSSFMNASPIEAKKSAAKMVERWKQSEHNIRERQLEKLFLRLNKQFPGDIGLFCIYFLNYLTLKPGEAIYLDAGLPHAYLQGDCVEVMARSDNVVRAGLTPKVRDVATLLQIVVYKPTSIEDIKFKSTYYHSYVQIFRPPIIDFALSHICVPRGETFTLPVLKSASILIVTKGKADSENTCPLEPGVVLFLPCNYVLKFSVTKDSMEMYQAHPNI